MKRIRNLAEFPWLDHVLALLDEHMDQDGGHDLAHIERVLVNARTIADGEAERGANLRWDAIAAAVLLHDLINLPKNHPERHLASAKSADSAVDALASEFDESGLVLIHEAIRTHSYSSGLVPESLEAKVVTDSDRLEAIGAFGVARTFYVSGMLKRSIINMNEPFGGERELDDAEYGVDHFFKKLLFVRELMHTTTGRELADQRHEYCVGFLKQIALEVGYDGPLP